MSNIMIFETPDHADLAIGLLEEVDNEWVYGIVPCGDGFAIHVSDDDGSIGCLME